MNTYGAGHVNMYNTYYTSATYYQKASDQNGYGGMAYYSSPTCGYPTTGSSMESTLVGSTSIGCTSDYDQSEIKYVVDNWAADKLKSADLKEDSLGYKVRLITLDDLTINLGYDQADGYIVPSQNGVITPEWVYNSSYSYWTMNGFSDSAWFVRSDGYVNGQIVQFQNYIVRPVITLLKSAIK